MAILPSTTTTSKTGSRTTGPRSFGRRMVRVGMGLLLLLLVAEGAVVMPEEAAASEGAGWSDPVSSSPGRQGRVVGADRAALAAKEDVVMMEDGHDTTRSHRYDFAAAAAAGSGAVVTAQDGSRLYEFPRRPETTEEDGIEMTEDGSRTHEFSTPRRVNIKNSKKTSQSLAELSEQSGSTSRTLYLIRHANKSCHRDHDAKLCAAGEYRRDHLKDVFGNGKKYAKPDRLFAYYYDKTYTAQRCYDTLTSMASLNNNRIYKIEEQHDEHRNVVGAHAIRYGEHGLKHSNVVLAAWEHEHMENMAHELGMNHTQHEQLGYGRKKDGTYKKVPGKYYPGTGPYACDPPWPADTNFDYLYVFKYGNGPENPPTYIHCHHQHIHISPDLYHPSHKNPCLYDASDKNTKHTCY